MPVTTQYIYWLIEFFVSQVKEAHEAKIPSIPATGGHSTWSSINNGLIIDLSKYGEVAIDPHQHTVAVRGGVLMKELQVALSQKG